MDPKRAVIVTGVIILIALGVYALYKTKPQTPLAPAEPAAGFDPLNASYTIDGSSVTLVNGAAEQIRVSGEPVRGDLSHDGREDAALLLVRETDAEDAFYVAAALNVPGRAARGTNAIALGETFLGEDAGPPALEIRGGSLIVNGGRYFRVWGTELREVSIRNEFLEVESPRPYDRIQNPVIVSGRSNFYEANTRIRIKDTAGNVLADTFTTATGWMNALYPFSAEVPYTKPAVLEGVIEVFEESAEDGSEVRKISIPVIFAQPS